MKAVKRGLRIISMGQYQTTLYNKTGTPFFSSVLGGVITLVMVAGIGSAIVWILTSVLMWSHFNLDISAESIQAYMAKNDSQYYESSVTDCLSNCRQIKVKDYPALLG